MKAVRKLIILSSGYLIKNGENTINGSTAAETHVTNSDKQCSILETSLSYIA